METLKVRVYEGRKLLYDENGKVVNKSQSIKMSVYHFQNKFLQYFSTLGPCLVVIEEVYRANAVKNGQSTIQHVGPNRFAEFQAMLDEKQNPAKKEINVDPLKTENEDLKARIDKLELLIKEKPEPKKATPPAKRIRAKVEKESN